MAKSVHAKAIDDLAMAAASYKPHTKPYTRQQGTDHSASRGETALRHVIWCDKCLRTLRGLHNTAKLLARAGKTYRELHGE